MIVVVVVVVAVMIVVVVVAVEVVVVVVAVVVVVVVVVVVALHRGRSAAGWRGSGVGLRTPSREGCCARPRDSTMIKIMIRRKIMHEC